MQDEAREIGRGQIIRKELNDHCMDSGLTSKGNKKSMSFRKRLCWGGELIKLGF